jgi:hypothetical protein
VGQPGDGHRVLDVRRAVTAPLARVGGAGEPVGAAQQVPVRGFQPAGQVLETLVRLQRGIYDL